MKVLIGTLTLIALTVIGGYAIQEETGICLPERHAADQADAKFCHCLDMGGYRYCKKDENGVKHWNYGEWSQDGSPTPGCAMSCKEDHCSCCTWQDDYEKRQKRKAALTIPYDPI